MLTFHENLINLSASFPDQGSLRKGKTGFNSIKSVFRGETGSQVVAILEVCQGFTVELHLSRSMTWQSGH